MPRTAGTNQELILSNIKRTQELRRARFTAQWCCWALIVMMFALIYYAGEQKQASYEAAQVCKEFNAEMRGKANATK